MPPNDDLNARLLAAHAAKDRDALIELYALAGEQAGSEGRAEACGFYLTHAYVFALEAGDPRAANLHARLKSAGREE